MTNAHQKSWERLKNVPFRRLMRLFLHCHPLLNPAPKTHFLCFLGGPGHRPPQYCRRVKMPPFFMGLQNHVFMRLARKWGGRLGPPKTMVSSCKVVHFVFFLSRIALHWTMDDVQTFEGVYITIKFIREWKWVSAGWLCKQMTHFGC